MPNDTAAAQSRVEFPELAYALIGESRFFDDLDFESPAAGEAESGIYTTFSPLNAAALIEEDEVHVWLMDLDLPALSKATMEALLSDDEAERCVAFAFPHLRRRFRAAHAQMREILSAYTATPAVALKFNKGAEGKPILSGESGPSPVFNLSHSGNLAMLAIANDGDLGVDIEQQRKTDDLDSLAASVFAPSEYAVYQCLPEHQRLGAFFKCWTRKEAVIKADGRGLGMKLDSFVVPFEPGKRPSVTFEAGAVPIGFQPRLIDLPAPPGFSAALAAPAGSQKIRFLRLPSKETGNAIGRVNSPPARVDQE
ncbi:4'-phosphopantetheinyl transferase superfamily protein [Sulfitobacter sp. BDSS02]|nr:4'-phosphopantetheinyl transferase superfamily protein [Sulfitobacter sp. BDSS02]MBR9849555.1 4'-phosphopantetheinyl transferase superfamily protein [Paracoccaceae bacterium]